MFVNYKQAYYIKQIHKTFEIIRTIQTIHAVSVLYIVSGQNDDDKANVRYAAAQFI